MENNLLKTDYSYEGVTNINENIGECDKSREPHISENMSREFETIDLPFFGCDFDTVYPTIQALLPKEKVSFEEFGDSIAIMCEIICASICHKINWDYLRSRIYDKTLNNPEWLLPYNLEIISENEVYELLCTYEKKERIRADERSTILRHIGIWSKQYLLIRDIFMSNGKLLDYTDIHQNLLKCDVFSSDPQEKKLQLLIQKVSFIKGYEALSSYYQPAIDYHLIRSYLRRGLIICKTKKAWDYINNVEANRTERTVAAIRMHCSNMIKAISEYTHLDISTINLIEWHIGRSVCMQEKADCKLENKSSSWLKFEFEVCPFYHTCTARRYNQNFLNITEPNYNGTSY